MRGLIIRFVVTGVAVLLATEIVPGIRVESVAAGLAAVLVVAFLNAVVRPVLYLLSLPLIIVTLGLFMVVINALLLQLAAWLVKGFVVEGFWPSVWGALLISVVSTILNVLVSDTGQMEVVVHRNRRPPKIINPE
jgi:putative membrane protein